jgi:uncharacterized membrane protein
MIDASTLLCAIALLRAVPLHAGVVSTPIPHWVVLLVVVPSLWLLIGASVLAVDRLLRRFGA